MKGLKNIEKFIKSLIKKNKKELKKQNIKSIDYPPYERLLRALEIEKDNIIEAFKKQGGTKNCIINFKYDCMFDYYKIKIQIKENGEIE